MTASVRALSCPSCGAPIEVRAAGFTVTIVCGNCGSTLDATDPALGLIEKSARALNRPAIALGTRGRLEGVDWDVIGYLERSGDGAQWQEYLLFNPYHGYRFLIDDGSRFRFGTMLDRLPAVVGRTATLDGIAFDGGDPYEARVDFVVGEFYWRVTVGETVTASEYGGGGRYLSREENDREVSWTRIDRLPPGVAETAFGLPPRDTSDDATDHGGSPHRRALLESLYVGGLAIVLLFIVMLAGPAPRLALSGALIVEPGGKPVTQVFGPFALDRGTSAVGITASASVDNARVELDYALVNTVTQQRFEAGTTAEYYRGRDSDGDWSEGDSRPEVIIASLPRGRYNLVVDAQAYHWQAGPGYQGGYDGFGRPQAGETPRVPPVAISFSIIRDARFNSSFLLALLAILAWPAWLLWREWQFHSAGSDDE